MAGVLLNIGGRANMNFCEYFVDDEIEVQYLPTTIEKGTGPFKDNPSFAFTAPIGSTCKAGSSNGIQDYKLFSTGWKNVTAKSSSGGGGVTSASELDTEDTYGLIGDPESTVILQPLIDTIADMVMNNLLTKIRFNQHISPDSTDHDARYYTQAQVNTKISNSISDTKITDYTDLMHQGAGSKIPIVNYIEEIGRNTVVAKTPVGTYLDFTGTIDAGQIMESSCNIPLIANGGIGESSPGTPIVWFSKVPPGLVINIDMLESNRITVYLTNPTQNPIDVMEQIQVNTVSLRNMIDYYM